MLSIPQNNNLYIFFLRTFLWILHTRLTSQQAELQHHRISYIMIQFDRRVVVLNFSSYYFLDDLFSNYLSFKLKIKSCYYESYYLYFIVSLKNRWWQRVALKIHAHRHTVVTLQYWWLFYFRNKITAIVVSCNMNYFDCKQYLYLKIYT